MPCTPTAVNASFTSSSLKWRMIASIFFIESLLEGRCLHDSRNSTHRDKVNLYFEVRPLSTELPSQSALNFSRLSNLVQPLSKREGPMQLPLIEDVTFFAVLADIEALNFVLLRNTQSD